MKTDPLSEQLSLFLCVLEQGSLSAAARTLQLAPSSVARRIDALEQAFGARLLVRTTHQVQPTPAGRAFAERARRILDELRLARAETVALDATPEGLIRIDAPAPFGRRHLAPALADFLALHPGLDAELRLIDSFTDMQGNHLGDADLLIRAGAVPASRLVATPLAPLVRVVCASPAYLARRGVPASPAELAGHDGLDWSGPAPAQAWLLPSAGRWQPCRPARLRLCANNAETLLAGALAGLGIANLPTWLVSDHLVRGELVALFAADGLPAAEASGIYALRLERAGAGRTRLLLDFLRQRFGFPPPWDRALARAFQPASGAA